MIVLLGLLVYALIGLVCMVIYTYFDVKFDRNTTDNSTIIGVSVLWPISLPIFIAFGVGDFLNYLITCLRVYFQQNKE